MVVAVVGYYGWVLTVVAEVVAVVAVDVGGISYG